MVIEAIPGISAEISVALQHVFSHFANIETVRLFGSRAKKSFKSGSDIDLAVFAPMMSDAEFNAMWDQVDALPIIFKIDLLHWDRLTNQALKEKVLAEGHILYRGRAV